MSKAVVGKLLTRIPSQNILGENVIWHGKEQAIYWIDIEAALLQRYQFSSATLCAFRLPQRIGSFAFLADIPQHDFSVIAAFAEGFALYNPHTEALKWLCQPEAHLAGRRFNDGRVSRQGEFFAGTMLEDTGSENSGLDDSRLQSARLKTSVFDPAAEKRGDTREQAALYRLDPQGKAQQVLDNLSISNGLCWSLDGHTLYHADSPRHQIRQFQFDPATGSLSHPTLFATTPDNAHPDGSTIDAAGYLWNAHWGAGTVVRYQPDGQVDLQLNLPVSQPSSVAIGGPNMDLLLITTSRLGLSATQLALQPEAGDLFIYQLHGITGVPENHCQLSPQWLD